MNQRGVTLIEILIVVGILGVLMAIAAVNLNNYIQSNRITQASQELAQNLRRVGSQALTQSQSYTLTVEPALKRVRWVSQSGGGAGNFTLPANMTFTLPTGGCPTNPVVFTGRGMPRTQCVMRVGLGTRPPRDVILWVTGKVVVR